MEHEAVPSVRHRVYFVGDGLRDAAGPYAATQPTG